MMKDPTLEEIYKVILDNGYSDPEMSTERAIAVHYFAESWYQGEHSNLYRVLCSIGYNAKGLCLESESQLTQEIYRMLERHFYSDYFN